MLPTITVKGEPSHLAWTTDIVAVILGYGLRPGEWTPIDDNLIVLLIELDPEFAEYDWHIEFANGVYNLYLCND